MKDLYAIIKGCVQNDRRQQKALYDHYYGFAFKVVYRYIYRYDKVADVVNDGFVKAFRSFSVFVCPPETEIERTLMAWLKKIMVHVAIDELRRNHLMPEIGSLQEHTIEEADQSSRADNAVLFKELMAHVKKLPPVYRAVFNMFVIDGFSHPEIAQKLGITVGTSKSNLFKARAYLQNIISKDLQQADICNF